MCFGTLCSRFHVFSTPVDESGRVICARLRSVSMRTVKNFLSFVIFYKERTITSVNQGRRLLNNGVSLTVESRSRPLEDRCTNTPVLAPACRGLGCVIIMIIIRIIRCICGRCDHNILEAIRLDRLIWAHLGHLRPSTVTTTTSATESAVTFI